MALFIVIRPFSLFLYRPPWVLSYFFCNLTTEFGIKSRVWEGKIVIIHGGPLIPDKNYLLWSKLLGLHAYSNRLKIFLISFNRINPMLIAIGQVLSDWHLTVVAQQSGSDIMEVYVLILFSVPILTLTGSINLKSLIL